VKDVQWSDLIQWARDLCALASFAALLIRPVREWLFGFGAIREGLRCMLRSEITRLYYRHRDDRQLREFEFKNMQQCYDAYKALKGNSFIDRLHGEMQEWDII
jgi:hypothetical protein